MPRYIQKRRQRWYAVLDIPSDVRATFDGKPRFVESLKTKNEAKAVLLAGPKIALWKLQIAKAKGPTGDLEEATFWRRQVDAWEQEDGMPLSDAIVARAEEIKQERLDKLGKKAVKKARKKVQEKV